MAIKGEDAIVIQRFCDKCLPKAGWINRFGQRSIIYSGCTSLHGYQAARIAAGLKFRLELSQSIIHESNN